MKRMALIRIEVGRSVLTKSWPIALIVASSVAVFAAGLRFSIIKQDVVLNRLHACPAKDLDREHQLQSFFAEAGCSPPALEIEEEKHSKFGNVICTLKGLSDQKIVVGAHFDHVSEGAGAVDNWSGASLLPSLYESLAGEPRKHTFVFVGFYGEEQGMVGSEHYVKVLGKAELAQIDAMMNMDTLGLGPTEVWASHADKKLVNIAFGAANAMKLPLSIVNVDQVGSTDSESFRNKKVPSITFHSLTQSTLHILHTKDDQLAQIKESDYYDTYRLLTAYLVYLDNESGSSASSEK